MSCESIDMFVTTILQTAVCWQARIANSKYNKQLYAEQVLNYVLYVYTHHFRGKYN